MSSAYAAVNPNGGLNASSFTSGTWVIRNEASSTSAIQSVSFDISSSLLPDMVFDPLGLAGDTTAKGFTVDSQNGDGVGLLGHRFADGSDEDGWLQINFSDLEPSETLTFSIDVDPASIEGTSSPGPHRSGSVSGLELIGSEVTVTFADNSVVAGELFRVPSTNGGGQVFLAAGLPSEPTCISVVGLGAGPAAVTEPSQQVVVSGPVGGSVRLLVVEGGAFADDGVLPEAPPLGPFDANSAVKVTQLNGTIGANGTATFNIQLTETAQTLDANESGETGFNYITAALLDADGRTGPPTAPIVLKLGDEAGQAPTDIQVSSTSFDENVAFAATLTATDPDSTAFTFSLLNNPSGQFEVQGNQLSLTQPIDFENLPAGFVQQNGTATVGLDLEVQDESGNAFSETVTLTVNDVDEDGPSPGVVSRRSTPAAPRTPRSTARRTAPKRSSAAARRRRPRRRSPAPRTTPSTRASATPPRCPTTSSSPTPATIR